ncbi:MAG: hypothetical protein QG635_163, partial [Bacteroidota bacterium]|nr:hypothetical protein [Bacteroidota bacterium]
MRILTKVLLILTLTVAAGLSVFGRTYYVSDAGNNNNSGTSTADAWRTIQHGVDNANSGDMIICTGLFSESVTVDVDNINIHGASPSSATLSGSGLSSDIGFNVLSSGFNLSYFYIRNFRNDGNSTLGSGSGIFIDQSTSNHTLSHLNISNCNWGLFIYESSSIMFTASRLEGFYQKDNSMGGNAVMAYTSSSQTPMNQIRIGSDNTSNQLYFGNCESDIIYFMCDDAGDADITGAYIRGNTFRQTNDAYCVKFSHLSGTADIDYNYFYGANMWTSFGTSGGHGYGIDLLSSDESTFADLFIGENYFWNEGSIVVRSDAEFPGDYLYDIWMNNGNKFYSDGTDDNPVLHILHTASLLEGNGYSIHNDITGNKKYIRNTIQDAISDAGSNVTIKVSSGTFREGGFSLDYQTILGAVPTNNDPGSGADAPIINGLGLNNQSAFVFGGNSNVTVRGFRIQHFDYAFRGVDATCRYITLENNTISDIHIDGINIQGQSSLSRSTDWSITSNYFGECGGNNIDFRTDSAIFIDNNIINVGASTTYSGIYLDDVKYPRIRGNQIYTSEGYAFNLNNSDGQLTAISCNGITVTSPIETKGAMRFYNLKNFFVYNNTMSLSEGQSAEAYYGVSVEGASTENLNISGNIFDDNNSNTMNAAIFVNGEEILNGGEIHINENNFDSFHTGIIYNAQNSTANVDGMNNWWGSANGPTHSQNTYNKNSNGGQGIEVSNNVTYVPWLRSSQGSNGSCGIGFVPASGNSFAPVTDDFTNPTKFYSNIVDAVSSTITNLCISSGTFSELTDLTINRDVTLQNNGPTEIVANMIFAADAQTQNITYLKGNYIFKRIPSGSGGYIWGYLDIRGRKVVLSDGNLTVEAKIRNRPSGIPNANLIPGTMLVTKGTSSLIQKNVGPNDYYFYPTGVQKTDGTFFEAWTEVNVGNSGSGNEQITINVTEGSPTAGRPGDDRYALNRLWKINYSNSMNDFSSGNLKFYWPNGASAGDMFNNGTSFPARWNTSVNPTRWDSYRSNVTSRSSATATIQSVEISNVNSLSEWAVFSGNNSSALVDPPSRVPSYVLFRDITDTEMTVRWPNVPCDQIVVVMQEGTNINNIVPPENGNDHLSVGVNDGDRTHWANAPRIGTSETRAVYSSNGANIGRQVTIDGLKPGTSYIIAVYPANGISEDYLKYQTDLSSTTRNPRAESTLSRVIIAADNPEDLNYKAFCSDNVALRFYLEGIQPFNYLEYYTNVDGVVRISNQNISNISESQPYFLYEFMQSAPRDYSIYSARDANDRLSVLYYFADGSSESSKTMTIAGSVSLDVSYAQISLNYEDVLHTNDFSAEQCQFNNISFISSINSYPSSSFDAWYMMEVGETTWTRLSGSAESLTINNLQPQYSGRLYKPRYSFTPLTENCTFQPGRGSVDGPVVTLLVSTEIALNYDYFSNQTYCLSTPTEMYVFLISEGGDCTPSNASVIWQYKSAAETEWHNMFDQNGNLVQFIADNTDNGYYAVEIEQEQGFFFLSLFNPSINLNNYYVRGIVGCGYCSTVSNYITLNVDTPPEIISSPVSVEVCKNSSNVKFYAEGYDHCDWYYKAPTSQTFYRVYDGAFLGSYINGSTSKTLTINNVSSELHNYQFSAKFWGLYSICPDIDTDPAVITVNTPPTVDVQPANVQVCETVGTASFSVDWSDYVCTSSYYNWQVNKGSAWETIAGTQNLPTLNLSGLTYAMNDQYQYRSVFYCADCTPFATNAARLTVDQQPVITTHPISQSVCSGAENITFNTAGTGNVIWKYSSDGVNFNPLGTTDNLNGTGAAVTLANNSRDMLISQANALLNGYKFYAIYGGPHTPVCSPETTSVATLLVSTPPTVSQNPQSVRTCEATNAQFTTEWHWTNPELC